MLMFRRANGGDCAGGSAGRGAWDRARNGRGSAGGRFGRVTGNLVNGTEYISDLAQQNAGQDQNKSKQNAQDDQNDALGRHHATSE